MIIIRAIAGLFLDLIEIVVVALALFVVCYLFLFQPHQVKGSSMEPNFHDNEFILTDKISYRFHGPERGDVVIFRAPPDRELDYIKRVIGLPGETVRITGGRVFVNGTMLNETYLAPDTVISPGAFLKENTNYIVPTDQYFVMGDNRDHSSDSREWGTVNINDIIGKAWFRYWPITEAGLVPKINY